MFTVEGKYVYIANKLKEYPFDSRKMCKMEAIYIMLRSFVFLKIPDTNKLNVGDTSGEGFVFLYSWFLLISHWKEISQSNKESSGRSVIAPVGSCAVRDSCEFVNRTAYACGWKGALYAPAC
jgi:hypothetical protein